MLERPLTTKKPHFNYKYVIMQGEKVVRVEKGIDRIADLELLPEFTS